jgi:lysophospholipase L1-like esterase
MAGTRRRRLLAAGGALAASTFFVGGVENSSVRILALGDSYTVGTSVAPEDRWVDRLASGLRTAGRRVDDPAVVAADGWTTDRLETAIDRRTLAPPYDVVTLLIGANDAFQARTVEEFRPTFERLLGRAVGFAGEAAARVVVMTVPDYSVTPVGQRNSPAEHAERLAAYNAVVREAADATGAPLVDLVPVSRRAADEPALVAADGLHPSPEQHRRWLERIYPTVRAVLDG